MIQVLLGNPFRRSLKFTLMSNEHSVASAALGVTNCQHGGTCDFSRVTKDPFPRVALKMTPTHSEVERAQRGQRRPHGVPNHEHGQRGLLLEQGQQRARQLRAHARVVVVDVETEVHLRRNRKQRVMLELLASTKKRRALQCAWFQGLRVWGPLGGPRSCACAHPSSELW